MNRYEIAICDKNERYAMGLSSLLNSKLKEPYHISIFTSSDSLNDYSQKNQIDILLITESAYLEIEMLTSPENVMILRENPDFVSESAILIDRYQSREEILNSVIENLPDCLGLHFVKRQKTHKWKVVGVYSPIRRCLQTSFAMTLGQALAKTKRVLYMNFENFSGFSGILNREFETNVIDLLYFFDCDRDKLAKRIPATVHSLNGMDILPPANSYLDTYERTGEQWIAFFEAIEECCDYQILILDLTDAMQGLVEIMGYCDRIYTLVKDDYISQMKMEQYENWMVLNSHSEIISKSLKFDFPIFDKLPDNPELLTKSELAAYAKAVIRDDELEIENNYG